MDFTSNIRKEKNVIPTLFDAPSELTQQRTFTREYHQLPLVNSPHSTSPRVRPQHHSPSGIIIPSTITLVASDRFSLPLAKNKIYTTLQELLKKYFTQIEESQKTRVA